MGQKVSPIGFRTGIVLEWQSTWFAPKANYGSFLVEDQKIREYVDKKYNRQLPKGAVAKIEIIRTRNEVKVTLHSARPGIVIGPRGGEVEKLSSELTALTGRNVSVNVIEIKEPDLNAKLVAEVIAEQLCKRVAFRRTMKMQCEAAMNADANVDYATATAHTTYGAVGVKVWIYKGKFGEELEVRPTRRRRVPRQGAKPWAGVISKSAVPKAGDIKVEGGSGDAKGQGKVGKQ
jgi:small subunit ribosomal protein S3